MGVTLHRKSIVVTIIILFTGVCIFPSISGYIYRVITVENDKLSSVSFDELAAFWRFDEGSGTVVYDSSGNNYDGTISGATWVDGISGTALSFDGEDDYVDTADFDIEDNFTVSLWINPSSTEYGQAFIGKHTLGNSNLLLFGYYSDGPSGFSVRIRNDVYREGVMTTGWHHLAYVGKKMGSSLTYVTVYKDGTVLWRHNIYDTVGNVLGKPWTIGQDWNGIGRTDFFNGIIDEIRIYNRALCDSEVFELWHEYGPVADANGPYCGMIGDPIYFDGSGSYDSDGTIVSYFWDFGDGFTDTVVNPVHEYLGEGVYTVGLTVVDDDGLSHTDTTTASIGDVPLVQLIYPTDDAFLNMYHPDTNTGSYTRVSVRNRYGPTPDFESDTLIKFDLSTIPGDGIIQSATLYLYYYHFGDNDPAGHELTCYRITSDWDELTVTWNTRPSADCDITSSSIVPDTINNWMAWKVTEDVEDFYDGAATNYGWKIMDETYWGATNIPYTDYYSKENGYNIPYLEITMVPKDDDPPLVQLIYPTGGETLSGTETVRWFALDDHDPDLDIYLYYRADGGQWTRINSLPLDNTGEYAWDTTSVPDGSYKLKVEAMNKYNIITSDTSDSFTIDNGYADVKVTDVLITDTTIDSSRWVKNGDTVEVTADVTSGQHLTREDIVADLTGFSRGTSIIADSYDGSTALWVLTNVDCNPNNGLIIVTITADNLHSNSATIFSDNTAPVLTIVKPENGLYLFNRKVLSLDRTIIVGAVTIEITTDNASGIAKAEFYIDDELQATTIEEPFSWYMNQRTIGRHTLKTIVYDHAGNTASESQGVMVFNLFGPH